MTEEKILQSMRILGLSREEAIEMLTDDERIDKGEKLFELSPEQKKASKTARQTPRKVDAYGKTTTRERKADTDKHDLIQLIAKALWNSPDFVSQFEVTNPEREITLTANGRKFKIVLSAPRS